MRHRKRQLRLPRGLSVIFAAREACSSKGALPKHEQSETALFAAGGTMGTLMQAFDWTASPLGPVSQWPSSFRTAVRLCLDSQFPIILFWGTDLIMLYNDSYCPIWGDKHPSTLGQPAARLWSKMWSIVGPMLHKVLDTGQTTWSHDLLLPVVHQGVAADHYFTFSYSPIRDDQGRIGGVFCPVTETTARVLSERRLECLRTEAEAERDRFTHTLESMSDRFLVFDRDWRIIFANTAAAQFMHHRLEDLLGKVYWEEFSVVLGTIIEREFRRAVAEQVTVRFEVYYAPWQSWAEARAYPLPEGGLAVFFLDITARKQTEQALAQHMTALHLANRDLHQFSYLSAHDLQEQVRTVAIYTQLLAHEHGPQLEGSARQYVERVVTASTHLSALLHDVLTYLALDQDTQEIVAVDSEKVWQEVLKNLQGKIIQSQASITHTPLPMVQADVSRFTLLLCQLVDNALKFHQPGTPPAIHVWAERLFEEWQFAVCDRGIGLAPDYAESIFGVGRRLYSQGQYPGTGMGLAICKKIIDQHGGRIWVDSTSGEGSTFYFTLPTFPLWQDI